MDDDGHCGSRGTGRSPVVAGLGSLLLAAFGLGLLGFVAFYLSGAGTGPVRRWVTDFAYIPVATASTWLCLRATWRPGLDGRTRWAWRVFAMAAGWRMFAAAAWWWLDASSHQTV